MDKKKRIYFICQNFMIEFRNRCKWSWSLYFLLFEHLSDFVWFCEFSFLWIFYL